jgi:hypothetical protein
MKIKMNLSVSGPGLRLNRGQEYDLPDDKAAEYLNAHYATPVAEPQAEKREKATRKSIESR